MSSLSPHIIEAEIGGGYLLGIGGDYLIGIGDDAAGPFPSRAFALAVAHHHQHREARDACP